MILPDLKLLSRVNQTWQFSGMDSIDQCFDKNHFLSYPHSIIYNYNSRGFRDQEWPESLEELANAIWCIGDSFTVGLGSPLAHTWPYRLSVIRGQKAINVSMDGASNEWIANTAQKIIDAVNPKHMVLMWSYTNRREHQDISLGHENRRIHVTRTTVANDWDNFLKCKQTIEQSKVNAVHFTVPNFHSELLDIPSAWQSIRGPSWPVDAPDTIEKLNLLPQWILDELADVHHCLDNFRFRLAMQIIPVTQLDLARDGNHFDLITADWVAKTAAYQLEK